MPKDVGDDPNIPGRIAQCEWCGFFVNTFTNVELHYCPNCHNGTLRDDCPHCGAPIAFPPQLNCLACGGQFTIEKMEPVPGGIGTKNLIEPDAKRRAELEAKGNHWHDVVRGQADGPELPDIPVPPPAGWSKEDWQKKMRGALIDQGEDLISQDAMTPLPEGTLLQQCPNCGVGFITDGPLEVCSFCGASMGGEGVDSGPRPE